MSGRVSRSRWLLVTDQSLGQATAWKWDFGDGATSAEQHPQHAYTRAGDFVVTLEVSGPEGTSRFQRVWDVSVR
jgi:PKD repeat protein